MSDQPPTLRYRIDRTLADQATRGNIRRAMDGLIAKRQAAFPDADELERLRDQGQAIRDHALSRLPELLDQLDRQCSRNGIKVHWAEDAAAANRIIVDMLHRRGTHAVIKGKSMVTEEIGLNAALAGPPSSRWRRTWAS